ncbi:MAG TPA: glycine cleavage system protein H [Dehalococcoidia bacterium]|nr:glycine cleavage system protein H [Dehalococcoidia bacterium]
MKNLWGKELRFPEDVSYTPELLWVKNESGNKLRIGISDLGVKAVKQLLYIRIKSRVRNQVKKGDLIGMVETSKMVWEIIAPVSGVVVAVNEKLLPGNPLALEHDPYGEGWIIELEKTSETESELQQLHKGGEAKTKKWIEEQVKAIMSLREES